MMLIPKFFSLRNGLIAFVLLAALWMVPDSLVYSQSSTTALPSSEHLFLAAAQTMTSPPPPAQYPPPINPPAAKTGTTAKPPATSVQDALTVDTSQRPSIVTQAILLSLLSLMPFIIMVLTSFMKLVVVLSLLRTALGVQQAPPNQVINGVAFLLSLFIMYPTGAKMYDAVKATTNLTQIPDSLLSPDSSTYVIQAAQAAGGPLRDFLRKNSAPSHQAIFYKLAYRGLPDEYKASLKPDDFIILVPSFITGQLKEAFEIGVLIYIPFFVIDLVTSNILLAMGMMMLSPVTISMPLKLFLLVMLDGWTILIEGLVKTFQ